MSKNPLVRRSGAQGDDTVPIRVVGGKSPDRVSSQVWLMACLRFMPPLTEKGQERAAADKVLTAAQAIAARLVNTPEHDDLPFNRTTIAAFCGYESANKAAWMFEWLESIGYISIEQQYIPGRRGRGDDIFTVYPDPHSSYVGPITHADLHRALNDPTFPRSLFLCSPRRKTAGQGLDAQVGTKTSNLGTQVGTKTNKPAGQGLDAQVGTFSDQIDPSPSEKEEKDLMEPVPGGAAEPPATGNHEEQTTVLELLGRLPWAQWARSNPDSRWTKAHVANGRLSLHPQHDVPALCSAITTALAKTPVTLDQVEEIATDAIQAAGSNPVSYVWGAMKIEMVQAWLQGRPRVVLVDDVIELPITAPAPPKQQRAKAKTTVVPTMVHPQHCGDADCDPRTRKRDLPGLHVEQCSKCNGYALARQAEKLAAEDTDGAAAVQLPVVVKRLTAV